ncbi:MAG: hypothetical protein IAF58_17890 [Leptolyngbya sp.]|nr:hypothetical protein [Candidatus Melainabacteria bacterium]
MAGQMQVITNGKSVSKAVMALALMLAFIAPANARERDDDFIMDTDVIGKSSNGVVSSDQFLELGVPTASALRIEGEQSLRIGNVDRALTVLQRSVEMAPMDIDGRIMYAEALEKRLLKQKVRDPKLFNFTIKQWLYVAKKSEFVDQSMMGVHHLQGLTGTSPKRWEKEKKFLARVMLPEDGSEKVRLGKTRNPQM